MPTFLDGQVNIPAINVPGVYIDIIPPNPNLNGVPTSIVGLVGVAQWGTPGTLIPVSTPTDCAVKIGVPQIRSNDIASHVWAACQVGGNIGFNCVRVTDGTDTAATATIQSNCLTLTAKSTGSLGNSITYNAGNGTQPNTNSIIISFPGAVSEIFNNIGTGVGSIATVAGTGYTSVPSASTTAAPTGPGNSNAVINPTLTAISATISGGSGGTGYTAGDNITLANGVVIHVATVSSGVIATLSVLSGGKLTGGAVPSGAQAQQSTTGSGTGASFVLGWGLGAPTIVNPGQGYGTSTITVTLTGGGGSGGSYTVTNSIWLNAANAINNGTAFHAASRFVVATAGVGASAPTLATPVAFTGGTDGAAGVTDATLLGSDVIPRKGMYALRNSGVDSFTLVDLSTIADYSLIDSFALSESCLAVLATPSGDTLQGAVNARVNAGLDDFETWLICGDWPYFTDTQNQVNRLINPTAFALGLVGNLSPEQSPLNKPLRGVTSTQSSIAGRTYSDTADLPVAEMGGIDVIVGPPTTWGGNYFTFATGRNAWSNTGGQGVNYSRLTNFIARSLQTNATGQIIGQLQSSKPNDQTRANAKALVDGFFGQLADSSSGTNGNGLIDSYATICDLTNNPLSLQARGLLFLYATVRYLNETRYFIIKLAAGGNVSVTSSSTPPTPTNTINP